MLDTIQTPNTDISSRAMLVQLSVRQWTGRKLDKRVSKEVADQHGASAGAGNYNKVLIARDALAEIGTIVGAARADHAKWSLPWMQDGTRIMPADAFGRYTAQMQKHRESFEAAVSEFIDAYPTFVQEAEARLGTMFNPSDYPDVQSISGRFAWGINVLPMPSADDFRVDLGAEKVEQIKSQMRDTMLTAVQDAMGDAWSRLHKVISAMSDKLSAYKPKTDTQKAQGVFRDSLVENVRELVEVLPALNLTGDAELSAMIDRARKSLTTHDAADLRENDAARVEVQQAAAQIADDMAAFMGA